MWDKSNITFVSKSFPLLSRNSKLQPQITNADIVSAGARINVPFSCGCNDQDFLNHGFVYSVGSEDTYSVIAETYFSGLTNVDMLRRFNSYDELNLKSGSQVNVVVNCSCGNSRVSKDYGLLSRIRFEGARICLRLLMIQR
ncbi:putative non-specific serine/threonine protein kinase [Helianthus annuus]|nr:putative non-specific serine/threonine protein kinase [Helianthus annuus]